MTKKLKSAKRVHQYSTAFQCPICNGPMEVVGWVSFVCSENHTFDFAKQGYINMLTHPVTSQYSKELFEARQRIITNSSLFTALHDTIAQVINQQTQTPTVPLMIADLGCGEGSHLQAILDNSIHSEIAGVGIDLSKEGIAMAAKSYDTSTWLVADLAKSPLAYRTFSVILNILSPANYREFKRIITPDGLVIKVVPGPNYLRELREIMTEKTEHRNHETVHLFKQHFDLCEVLRVQDTAVLQQESLYDLVRMTPLTWAANPAQIEQFCKQSTAAITIDLEILIGINPSSKNLKGGNI
ncbi:putative RNA methyltransferase [Oceanobacillus sp. FSL K6-2867]|uniref:putative RNA methyltransferase n=1 Tax=Oceanobacillus sp. FSL K6-2867 TaxID=2954748 RepID=UPI0030D70897